MLEKVFNKYDVTFVNFSLYSDTIIKDSNTSRLIETSQKIAQRLAELQKTGGK